MKKLVALIAALVLTWPAVATAQDDPKPAGEREALPAELSGESQELSPAVSAAREEDPRSGVAGQWARWLEDNPQRVADGEAPRYAMIIASQSVEPTLREVSNYVRLERDANPSVCADGIGAVESEHDDLAEATSIDDTLELGDLEDVSAEIAELSEALEACRVELAAVAESAAPSGPAAVGPAPRKPEPGDRAEEPSPEVDAVVEQEPAGEPDLDARATNDLIQRIEAIEGWNERLDALVDTVEGLHAETAAAIDAAGS